MTGRELRSWLVVPVSKPDEVARAARSGADAVVLDLVEFVPEARRSAAREAAQSAVAAARAGGAEVFVQITPESMDADLRASVWPGLAGVVISRAESPGNITEAAVLLCELERERSIIPDTLAIVAALETGRGNHAAHEIACANPRVAAITLGRADLVMDLRPEPSGEIHLMQYLMQRLIIVAGAAGVAPLGAWWRAPDRGLLATPERTRSAAERGRAIGFRGSMCLRPEQVEPINRAFASIQ